ncbi:hypothetical protein Q7P37_004362 [Cladosporium fusiforme]
MTWFSSFTQLKSAELGPIGSPSLIPRGDDQPGAAALDSHTIPIIFGTLGAVLGLASIVVGIVQIRRHSSHARAAQRDIEMSPTQEQSAVRGQDARTPAPTRLREQNETVTRANTF